MLAVYFWLRKVCILLARYLAPVQVGRWPGGLTDVRYGDLVTLVDRGHRSQVRPTARKSHQCRRGTRMIDHGQGRVKKGPSVARVAVIPVKGVRLDLQRFVSL